MQQLLEILEEEAEILDHHDPDQVILQRNLESAIPKIRDDGPTATLTPEERDAIKQALQDVGELYLFTGTSAGFDTNYLTEDEVKEHISRGEKARTQAAAIGVYL